jgi:hypothetical protein
VCAHEIVYLLIPILDAMGARGGLVVKALCYKPEGRGFETRQGELIPFELPNPSGLARPWGLVSL